MKPTNLQSITILGRQPALGLAELESLYGAAAVSVVSERIAGLTLPANEVNFMRLGGSTRLAEVITIIPSKLWKDVEKAMAKAIPSLAQSMPEGKLQLGFSTYDIPITPAKLNASALTLKKIIRGKTGRSVRITPNPELELNTAAVLHNHLTGPTGIEFLMVALPDGSTLLARTTAVQDIDSYTTRDRARPRRDARVGMLPPKLAQIIINLAVGKVVKDRRLKVEDSSNPSSIFHLPSSDDTVVLDPFCGTGVLLQEALLMGYNVYGTDLEPRMVDYSTENLEWFRSGQTLPASSRLEVGDATDHQWQPPVTVVAGETYLGRPFTETPSSGIIAETASDVNLILKKFLKNIHSQLAPGTQLCLAVPAWRLTNSEVSKYRSIGENEAKPAGFDTSKIGNQFKHLPLIDQMEHLGYNRTKFEHVVEEDLIYYREDQIVARELLVLTRN